MRDHCGNYIRYWTQVTWSLLQAADHFLTFNYHWWSSGGQLKMMPLINNAIYECCSYY